MSKQASNTTKSSSKTVKVIAKPMSLETVNSVDGKFREHGLMAVKFWNEADRASGQGDAMAALALAEYMEGHDKIIALVYKKKKDDKGNAILDRQLPFALSDVETVRGQLSKDNLALAAINKAIVWTVFGMRDVNMETMAVLKTRLSRAYPASIALLTRAKERGVKLADVISVDHSGRVSIAEHLRSKEAPTPKQIAEAKPVTLSVAEMGKIAKEEKMITPKVTQTNGTPEKSGEEKAAEASMLAKRGFIAACQTINLRLTSIANGSVTNNPLSPEELEAMANMIKAMDAFEGHKAQRARMAGVEEKKAEAPKRPRKTA